MKKKCTAIVLSAGVGKRMGSNLQKQYIEIDNKPIIYYTLKTFQNSDIIDRIVMVVGKGDIENVRETIVEAYQFSKVERIVEGGRERYDSVWNGLLAIREDKENGIPCDYVFIHDGARPFADGKILERGYHAVERYGACVAGVPSKDTVKIADDNGFAKETPPRKMVWTIQTPQIFREALIHEAYQKLQTVPHEQVTDDAMVVESMTGASVKLFEGSYRNMKITTPEDLLVAEVFLKNC